MDERWVDLMTLLIKVVSVIIGLGVGITGAVLLWPITLTALSGAMSSGVAIFLSVLLAAVEFSSFSGVAYAGASFVLGVSLLAILGVGTLLCKGASKIKDGIAFIGNKLFGKADSQLEPTNSAPKYNLTQIALAHRAQPVLSTSKQAYGSDLQLFAPGPSSDHSGDTKGTASLLPARNA